MSSGAAGLVCEADLHAYVDGVLAAQRLGDVESHLASHADDAERVAAWSAQLRALRDGYASVLSEPVPARLRSRRHRRPALLPRAIAAAALLAAGTAGGWVARGARAPRTGALEGEAALPRLAAIAHAVYAPEVRHPVEVSGREEAHLVAWLSKRLGTDLRAPHLAPVGYELMGGRLLAGPSGPVAQLMYADASGARLTLYVSRQQPRGRDTAFRFAQEGAVNVFYWIDGGLGYALSGQIARGELLRVAEAVYQQLEPE